MALKALAEWGVARSHVACGKEGLILELGELFEAIGMVKQKRGLPVLIW